MTPVTLVVPCVRRFDLLEKLLESAEAGTRRPDRYCIVDNGAGILKSGIKLPETAIVHDFGRNIGVSATWNFAYRTYDGHIVISNDDVEFGPHTIGSLVNAAELTDAEFIFPNTKTNSTFCVFLMKREVLDIIGEFDERFWPAYYEDVDFWRRMRAAGIKELGVNAPYSHVQNGYLKAMTHEERLAFHELTQKCHRVFVRKWGGPPGSETRVVPENIDCNLRLCVMSVVPELFHECIKNALVNARGKVSVVGYGNGVDLTMPPGFEHVENVMVRSPENQGVAAGLHELWLHAKHNWPENPEREIVCYIHDDLIIREPGWDQRVRRVFEREPECGLAGFGGSTAYGSNDIYRAPYRWQQVARQNFYSNMENAERHGARKLEEMPIVFTDGYSMIVRRDLLDLIGGFSALPARYVHYGYDCFIACMARRHQRTAWLVPADVAHGEGGWGGKTRVVTDGSEYAKLADKFGGDKQVHDDVHAYLYEMFRDVLPLRLR